MPGWHESFLHPSLLFPRDGDLRRGVTLASVWLRGPSASIVGRKWQLHDRVVQKAEAIYKCIVARASAHTHQGSQEGAGVQRLPLTEPRPGSFCTFPALGCVCAKPGWGFWRVIFRTADFRMWLAAKIRRASAI